MTPTAIKAAAADAKPAAPITGAGIEMARAKMVKMATLVKRPAEDSTLSKRFLTARLLPRLSTTGVEAESPLLTKAEGWGAKALVLAHPRAKVWWRKSCVSKHIRLAQSPQLGRDYIDLLLKMTYRVIGGAN